MSNRAAHRPTRMIPDAPPANFPIPPQQTFVHADEDRIRARAYDLWEADGRPEGDGVEYWYRAEHEIRGG